MGRSKRVFFGIVVGTAIGLLFSSVIVVLTSLWLIVFLCPIVLLGLVLGFWVGWKRRLLNVTWRVILLVVIVGWPICIWGPVAIRTLQFHWIASHEIPIYPGAEKIQTIATPLAADNIPGVEVLLTVKVSHEQIVKFYQDKLVQYGWKELPPSNINDYVYYCFEKTGRRIYIVIWEKENINQIRITCNIHNLWYRPKTIYID